MLRNYSFRDELRREVERLPLPPEDQWVPTHAEAGPRSFVALTIVAAAIVAAIAVAAAGSRLEDGPAAQQPVLVTLPPRPTVVNGVGIERVPVIYQNTRFNYNLVLPAWFRHGTLSAGTDAAAGPLERQLITARSEAEEARFVGTQFLPWDLIVEVWDRGGKRTEEWVANFGCPDPSKGANPCVLETTKIHGTQATVATRAGPPRARIYLIEHGDQLLVLRYAIGAESDRPAEVSEATLETIITSLGLP
ncbi:MAG: hypothetical protein M3P18_22085 [Actinomycetota bacterium]|nr:hypothetical protein [Actinomycetota bacterium]